VIGLPGKVTAVAVAAGVAIMLAIAVTTYIGTR
jgi:hypothetical protein